MLDILKKFLRLFAHKVKYISFIKFVYLTLCEKHVIKAFLGKKVVFSALALLLLQKVFWRRKSALGYAEYHYELDLVDRYYEILCNNFITKMSIQIFNIEYKLTSIFLTAATMCDYACLKYFRVLFKLIQQDVQCLSMFF